MTDFKWRHYQGDIILGCVRWYCKYGISYRALEEMMLERGLEVDHVRIYRWIQHYTLISAVNDQRYQQLCKQLMEKLNDTVSQIYPVRLTGNTAAQILQVIKQHHGRILLLETGRSFLTNDQTQELVMQADIPIIFLR